MKFEEVEVGDMFKLSRPTPLYLPRSQGSGIAVWNRSFHNIWDRDTGVGEVFDGDIFLILDKEHQMLKIIIAGQDVVGWMIFIESQFICI